MTPVLTPAVHEKGLALFVEPRYRNRFRESFANPRRRDKLRRKLAHFVQLDPRYTEEVASKKKRGANVETALRDRGAPERCYLLSEDSELDGRDMLLSEALAETVVAGSEKATFISCIPGKLAFFYGDGADNRLILERTE